MVTEAELEQYCDELEIKYGINHLYALWYIGLKEGYIGIQQSRLTSTTYLPFYYKKHYLKIEE